MPPSRAVGIDLGTARTSVARCDATGHPSLIRLGQGEPVVPSVVFFDDHELLFGRDAKVAAAAQPGRAAEYALRDMGQAAYSRALGGELLPAEVIQACLLKKLAGELAREQGPPAVALAVPAAFHQAQRRAMIEACQLAGLELVGTLTTPLAVAAAFAETQGYLAPSGSDRPGSRALVFDWGAGKLDVAVVDLKPGRLRTMASGGLARLGGRDLDVRLAEYLAGQFAKQFGEDPRHDMTSVRRLLESAEEARQSLSTRQQARVQVERGQDAATIVVTRQAFEELIGDVVEQAVSLAESIVARSGIAWRDITHLLLSGGATRTPLVIRRLQEASGLSPAAGFAGDDAVARGAALHAECVLAAREKRPAPVRLTLIDMTAHSLGLEWSDPQTGRLENVVLIPRGTELPCGTQSKALTDHDDQSTLALRLLEGESRLADQCARIARVTINDLPPGLPRGAIIDVQYQYTSEGRLQVKALLPKSGQPLPISVRRENGLSEPQLADWKKLLAAPLGLQAMHALLKQHARQQPEVREAPQVVPLPQNALPVGAARPPALPQPGTSGVSFSLSGPADPSLARRRRRQLTPRKIAILLAGYVVSAVVGTAIGYYILMRIDPSWNRWHLRLPGLQMPDDSANR